VKYSVICFVAWTLLGSVGSVRGGLVDQLSDPFVTETYAGSRAVYSHFDTGAVSPPNLRNLSTVYDNFTFAESGVVDSIAWAGAYDTAGVTGATFVLSLYDSLGPTAGSAVPVQQFTVGAAGEAAVAGIPNFFLYSTTAAPFTITGGTNYWLSIVAHFDYSVAGWGWAFSGLGGDNLSVNDFGDTSLVRETDAVDYALRISTVPEPNSCGVLGLVIAGWAGFRRRRSL